MVAATGVILAALYLLWAYQRVFHGEPDEDNTTFAELRLREGLVMAPLIGADRVPRRLPEAGARPDRAGGRTAWSPTSRSTPVSGSRPWPRTGKDAKERACTSGPEAEEDAAHEEEGD